MTDYAAVRRAYDTVAADYAERLPDTRAETALDLAMVDGFVAAVLRDRTDPTAAPVLDAGCGAGRMSGYLAARGVAVCGMDLSPGMVAMARRDHPEIDVRVGSLDELPWGEGEFAGVLLWYSIIHTPPSGLDRVLAEAVRVLRPGGHLLVGFQSGTGVRDVAPAYRRLGHDVRLERHLHTPDDVTGRLAALDVHEVARLVRRAEAGERDDQAVLLARRA
ncbi:class I SAM-dependent methyltransferase [Humibacillus xanthopallidus]|uniref:Methyltransferase family protein n=1 Tax=Humibacillus xanthopallidus TaxID=412689 RepID=A0A543HA01_9MICO|nr:class I SAM-dependent methyltransferase [Humibacillus xanthopallidus]TQM55158.1 methyltransferase family protein [Humibacillus xanthopallidus]